MILLHKKLRSESIKGLATPDHIGNHLVLTLHTREKINSEWQVGNQHNSLAAAIERQDRNMKKQAR